MAAKLVYEMASCSRCGGSGTYSYCSMYGSTCFKCRGRKKVASKAGAKAAAAVAVFLKDNFSVLAEDLKPGDRIRVDGVARTVTSVEVSDVATGWSSTNGVRKDTFAVNLTFDKPVPSPFGAYSSLGTAKGASYVRAVGGADWDTVVAFARTIKKGVTVVESGVAASEAV